jgi:DNA repair ATPase RecN
MTCLSAFGFSFSPCAQDLLACIEHLDEIKTEAEALATAEKVFQETEHKLGKADVQKKTLQLELETVTLQLESVQERLERMERLQQERRSTTAQTLERLQTESAQLELERQENNVELTQLHSQADALEQGMQARLEREGEEMNELLATYWALRQQIGKNYPYQLVGKFPDLYLQRCIWTTCPTRWTYRWSSACPSVVYLALVLAAILDRLSCFTSPSLRFYRRR